MMIIAGTGILVNIGWWEVLSFTSYIKIGSSVIKYMPQVYLNWKRKCTLGFAIDMGLVKSYFFEKDDHYSYPKMRN